MKAPAFHTPTTAKLLCLFILFAGTLLMMNSCRNPQKEIVPSPDFAPYVNAYTGGLLSQSSNIRIELSQELPLVDLNLADSADFDALPGIGGYFASGMVEYRRKLGGSYSYKEQLMDIRKFDRERYDALSDLITVDSAHVRPYPMWTLPEDSLRLHPYIGSYAAHGIVLFRENNPSSAWSVDALARAGVLRPEDASRLSRCRIALP